MSDENDSDEGLFVPRQARRPRSRWPYLLLGAAVGGAAVAAAHVFGVGPLSAAESTCGGFPTSPRPARVVRAADQRPRNVLVTGGAGFIASHFALMLIDAGEYNVTVIDDLSRGSIETVLRLEALAAKANKPLQFVRLDVAAQFDLESLLRARSIELVAHFSGNAYVGESMATPDDYFQNITASTVSLLRAMERAGVPRLIFSSSCATFGAPTTFPITEETPQRPSNPYGAAKLQAEQAIIAHAKAAERRGVSFSAALLRYFNVIGADPDGRLGPHLRHAANRRYPRIVDAAYDVALGVRRKLSVTGSKFPTRDGSAERDYIHVTDLVDAHVRLARVLRENDILYYNVGNGHPYTVLEIANVVAKVSGRPVPLVLRDARPGDPPKLYTDPAKIKHELGWEPKYAEIETMVRHGWDWRVKNYGPDAAPSIDPLEHSGPAFNASTDTAPALGANPRIVIVGAGPTGLCAAYRLTELGYTNWKMVEATEKASGLATTVRDDAGFFWDIGVHCVFSHFEFFDSLLDDLILPRDWLYHQRYSPAHMRGSWVGYPVQANLWRLPEKEVVGIISDLASRAASAGGAAEKPRDFEEWLERSFGKALTESFMAPYNAKVWAHPADQMNAIWVGERVATIKLGAVLSNVIQRKDAPSWGPNAQFRYPANGTGQVWLRVFDRLPEANKKLRARVTAVRTAPGKKAIELADGTSEPYDALLSTMPLPQLLRMTPDHPHLADLAEGENGAADHSRFKHQTVNLVGVGVWGTSVPDVLNGVHWVYFPEPEFIFYRVTCLSNFSPFMVAKPYEQWSLLVEVSESKYHPVPSDREELKRRVIDGLRRSGMLPADAKIASTWDTRLEYGYPVPYVERNMHVHAADAALRKHGVWSRGRFGSWKYEVANQDHSCMLGLDAVDSMLFGGNAEGREATFNSPNAVNSKFRPYDFDFNPQALAAAAGRAHTFGRPPTRLRRQPRWDFIAPRCKGVDAWTDRVRGMLVRQPRPTKWLVHSYEMCGAADIKRPMLEMLREGLNHVDRVPHTPKAAATSAWARHIRAHYRKLPERLIFTRADVPVTSSLFADSSASAINGSDFGVWGTKTVRLPSSMRERYCSLLADLTSRRMRRRGGRGCPERVVTMASPTFSVARERILDTAEDAWDAVLALLVGPDAEKNAELLDYAWHILFGEPAVIHEPFMHTH